MHQQIRGIIPPMVTPFDEQGRIDEAALRADVHYLVGDANVHGLAVGGSTGEGYALTTDEVRRVTACAVEEARGRVPVIAGIITNSTAAAIERARAVADLGVAALQVTPVHYLFRPDDDSMLRFFAEIADATNIPVIIYNVVPWSYLLPTLLARIMREVDGVIGVKQSASDLKTLADLLLLNEEGAAGTNKRILSAVDALLYPSFSIGAHGAVAAILTAVPEWSVELWTAVQQGEHARALVLHARLLRLWNAINEPNLPANVRAVMELRGRQGRLPRAPMPVASAVTRAKIQEALSYQEDIAAHQAR
jgi:4-hydroxy-tetrahydrodipicolinate synthase